MPALAIELPVSTTIMLRSIADVACGASASAHGARDQVRLSAGVRARRAREERRRRRVGVLRDPRGFARVLADAAQFMAERGLAQDGAPAVVRFIVQVAARYGIVVSEKTAAQALPLIGAAGGALVNALFMDHFQDVARGHFIVRRLEREVRPRNRPPPPTWRQVAEKGAICVVAPSLTLAVPSERCGAATALRAQSIAPCS